MNYLLIVILYLISICGFSQSQTIAESGASDVLFIGISKDNLNANTAIRFKSDATFEFDFNYDAHYLRNEYPINIYTSDQLSQQYSINSIPYSKDEIRIPLHATHPHEIDTFNLSFDISRFETPMALFLHDKYLNKKILLEDELSYNFSCSDDSLSNGIDRFEIIKGLETITAYHSNKTKQHLSIYPNPIIAENEFHIKTSLTDEIKIYDLRGELFYHSKTKAMHNIRLPKGFYIVHSNNNSDYRNQTIQVH